MKYDILAIGTSAGGVDAIKTVFTGFRSPRDLAVVVVQHLSPAVGSYLPQIIASIVETPVYEIEDKLPLKRGVIYTAPPNYHVLVEKDGTFALTTTEKVCFSRPSIDVTFESIADAFGERAVGVILTGANQDGGEGLRQIKTAGGYTLVQAPETAESREMPEFAIRQAEPDEIVRLEELGQRLDDILNRS